MDQETEKGQQVILLVIIALAIYNLIFFIGKFVPDLPVISTIYSAIQNHLLTFTILEFFGVGAVFVDLVANYELRKGATKRLMLFIIALILMAFLFKLFVNFLDSSYLVE